MDETKRAWDEVGDGFVNLRRIISERYRELGDERASGPATHSRVRSGTASPPASQARVCLATSVAGLRMTAPDRTSR
jgi:hypothetical protein